MNAEASARRIAVLAQSESTWALFIRSGQVGLIEDATLDRAQKDLERSLTAKKGRKGSRERQRQGAERIRGYLDGHRQPY